MNRDIDHVTLLAGTTTAASFDDQTAHAIKAHTGEVPSVGRYHSP